MTSTHDVLVVGAGAAGLMAALFGARAGADVLLLERTRDGGRKILISGGGRCNVLPGTFRPGEYVTDSSPNTLRKILRSWPLAEQRRFFEEELGIALKHEPEFDKLFPVSDKAREVRDRLVAAVRDAGGKILFGRTVAGIEPPSDAAGGEGEFSADALAAASVEPAARGVWSVHTDEGESFHGRALILATGGLSVPATGSDGRGLAWAEALGHTIHPTYPALTPLLADPAPHGHLAGVSLVCRLSAGEGKPREADGGFLFTHRGYSGPGVLNVSHVAVRSAAAGAHAPVLVDWTGEGAECWEERLGPGAGTVGSALGRHLPQRLADQILAEARLPGQTPLSQLRRDDRRTLVKLLTRYPLPWTGDEGYKKAEVTGGGVALGEVNPRTLESRVRPGLYLCGEILDAFGPIGGHNFLWAWVTGRAAGLGAAGRVAAS